jgi:hypothetical protein
MLSERERGVGGQGDEETGGRVLVAGAGGGDRQLSSLRMACPGVAREGGGRQAGGEMVGEANSPAYSSRCM